jgi:hypothetical protein
VRALVLAARAGAVVVLASFLVSLVVDGAPRAEPSRARVAASTASTASTKVVDRAEVAAETAAQEVVSIVAVGDIVMGSGRSLPPSGGRDFFDGVAADLAGDVVLGNLEGTLSAGGSSKCGAGSSNCFAFQTPPAYARRLVDAGFTIMNLANNHAFDYGADGQRQTLKALAAVGLPHTGRPGEITQLVVNGVKVAVLGFAPYPWAQSLTNIPAAVALVRKAAAANDLIVVTMHAGAEGRDQQHVRPGTEMFLGEDRGDPMRFARAVVDAGADLVIGHGPHVLRGMEWYRGRLIAYSLGNFAGYDVFSLGGPLSISAILRVELRGSGSFESGMVVPTVLAGKGTPARDPSEAAHGTVRTLSREDFGARGVRISPVGIIARPPAAQRAAASPKTPAKTTQGKQ